MIEFRRRRRPPLRYAVVLANVRGRIVNSHALHRSKSSFGDRRLERNRSERSVGRLTVSVTVLKDVLVVVLFALNMEMIE